MFKQELSILPAITKVIKEKLIFLMSLKNINGISFNQFKQWISLLQYWKRYTNGLIEQNMLINYEDENSELQEIINDAFKKMISIFNIDGTINQLVLNYITAYHAVYALFYLEHYEFRNGTRICGLDLASSRNSQLVCRCAQQHSTVAVATD